MIVVSPLLIVISIIGIIIFVAMLIVLEIRPEFGRKMINFFRFPTAFWTQSEGAGGMIIALIFLNVVFFSCILCCQLLGLIQLAYK